MNDQYFNVEIDYSNEDELKGLETFMVDWEGGHADAGTSRAARIRKWKFLLWQTGHPDFQLKK